MLIKKIVLNAEKNKEKNVIEDAKLGIASIDQINRELQLGFEDSKIEDRLFKKTKKKKYNWLIKKDHITRESQRHKYLKTLSDSGLHLAAVQKQLDEFNEKWKHNTDTYLSDPRFQSGPSTWKWMDDYDEELLKEE